MTTSVTLVPIGEHLMGGRDRPREPDHSADACEHVTAGDVAAPFEQGLAQDRGSLRGSLEGTSRR